MSKTQTLNQENLDLSKPINFAPRELTLFKAELDKQLAEGNGVNILKALRNAHYLAEIDRRIANVKAGRWTEHELIEVDDDE